MFSASQKLVAVRIQLFQELPNTENGVMKVLQQLNRHKVMGPDEVSSRLLKETDAQIVHPLTLFFWASLDHGKMADDWKSANITPLYKID